MFEDARFDIAKKCANIIDSACALIDQRAEQLLEIRTHRNSYGVQRVAMESRDHFVQPLEAVPDRGVKDGGVKAGLVINPTCGSARSTDGIVHRKVVPVLNVIGNPL